MSETTDYAAKLHQQCYAQQSILVSVSRHELREVLLALAAARAEVEDVTKDSNELLDLQRISKMANDGLAARVKYLTREVETVTKERDEAIQALATVGIEKIEGEWCYTSDNGEQPADSLADALTRTFALIDRDMVADLAAVRKVEEWLSDDPQFRCVTTDGRVGVEAVDDGSRLQADSFSALGRALAAQEAGDAAK